MNIVILSGKISNIEKRKPFSLLAMELTIPFLCNPNSKPSFNVCIKLNNDVFYKELKLIAKNMLILLKGRIELEQQQIQIVAEQLTLL